ncbi:hypothetical protein P3S67_000787 [Capsicum chacoense]
MTSLESGLWIILNISRIHYMLVVIPMLTFYVALLSHKIYDGIEVGDKPRMNIKDYIQGNALTDRYINVNDRVKYANHMGLISDKIYQSAKENCNGNYVNADPNNALCLNDLQNVAWCFKNIRRAHILEPWCDLPFLMSILQETPTNAQSIFPIAGPCCREKNCIYSYVWANDKAVQKALNVREGTALEWMRCNESMHYRGMKRTESYVYDVQSAIDDHQHLTRKSCRALIYSGDLDMVIPHLSSEEWIHFETADCR